MGLLVRATPLLLCLFFQSDGLVLDLLVSTDSINESEFSSATFKTREVCVLKCEVPCTNCSAVMSDGQEVELFHCKKSRLDQGRPLLIVIIENPCLFAFILLIILVITGAIIASSVLLHRMLPSHWFEIE